MVELLAARAAGGPLAAENERLHQELRAAQAHQTRLEASVRHLQQQLALAGGEGRRGRLPHISIERERVKDAQVRQAAQGVQQCRQAAYAALPPLVQTLRTLQTHPFLAHTPPPLCPALQALLVVERQQLAAEQRALEHDRREVRCLLGL